MKITYLYHSGFVLEDNNFDIVIDFYRDTEDSNNGYLYHEILPRKKRLYVLSSHFHEDHFSPNILTWDKQHPGKIIYIFSKDILRHRRASIEQAHWLVKGSSYKDDFLNIKAFGSTDIGISFYLQLPNFTCFHAGDLNNWHWQNESSADESSRYEKAFLGELKDICKEFKQVDITFFPIDARLGTDYSRGARQYLQQISSHYFIPMHFSTTGFSSANVFKTEAESLGTKFIELHAEGDYIEI